MAPAALAAQSGNTISLVVNFGYGSGATMRSSTPIDVTHIIQRPRPETEAVIRKLLQQQ